MAIPAKRFQFLDNETNVAISDFLTADNQSILNSPNNDYKQITSVFSEFLGNSKQDIDLSFLKDKIGLGSSAKDPLLRTTKDAISDIYDTSGFSPKDIDKLLSSYTKGNTQAQSALSQLSSRCKNKAAGIRNTGKAYPPSINCNGKSRTANNSNCNTDQFGNALNKLTNGGFNYSYLDPNALLNAITSLSLSGYDMNMCGVFGALNTLTNDINLLSRASSAIMGGLTSVGNTLGFVDLANSSAGLYPLMSNPNGIRKATKSFNIPSEIRQRQYSNFSDRYSGALELYDNNWNRSGYDSGLSISSIDRGNGQLGNVFRSKVMDNIYTENNLNYAPSDDFNFLTTALSF